MHCAYALFIFLLWTHSHSHPVRRIYRCMCVLSLATSTAKTYKKRLCYLLLLLILPLVFLRSLDCVLSISKGLLALKKADFLQSNLFATFKDVTKKTISKFIHVRRPHPHQFCCETGTAAATTNATVRSEYRYFSAFHIHLF